MTDSDRLRSTPGEDEADSSSKAVLRLLVPGLIEELFDGAAVAGISGVCCRTSCPPRDSNVGAIFMLLPHLSSVQPRAKIGAGRKEHREIEIGPDNRAKDCR